ncbi:MAG: hypothetical protein ABW073_06725 [Acidimicrobiia bacterium]
MTEPMKRLCVPCSPVVRLRGPDDLVRFVRQHERSSPRGGGPSVFVCGLAPSRDVTGAFTQLRSFGHGGIGARQLVSCAASLHTTRIALAWTVPPGATSPSALEIDAAVALGRELLDCGVALVDSVIVSGHRWWSCRDHVMSTCEKV